MKKERGRVQTCTSRRGRVNLKTRRLRVLEDAAQGIPVSETAEREGVHPQTIKNDRKFIFEQTGEIDAKAYQRYIFENHNSNFNGAVGRGLKKTDAAWGTVFMKATGLAVDRTELSGGLTFKTQAEADAARDASINRSGDKAAKK